jgi:hypothetical protein
VAVYGVSDSSLNLEASGEADVAIRGATIKVEARRLPPQEAAPILRDSLADAPAMIRRMTSRYFAADIESSLEEWEQESVAHPVFHLTPAQPSI